MKRIERLNINELWPLIENRGFLDPQSPVRFSDGTGFHIYADLRLKLDVSAAEDLRDAMKCVDLLEDFTAIGDKCANMVGARMLEAQGERLHFFLPSSVVSQDALRSLIRFSAAMTQTVYGELKADEDFIGFSMAAAFGPTVFVPSSFAGGSVVSLGNAANQPAKRLGRGVTSGHVALPKDLCSRLLTGKSSGDWIEVDVRTPGTVAAAFFDEVLTTQMRGEARSIFNRRRDGQLRQFANEWSQSIKLAQTPYRARGVCLRADLDGFTKSVEEAFKKGPAAVVELVRQFADIMEYAPEFINRLGRPVIEIPWAGDCCTLLIRPRFQETVEELRATLPVEAGRHWHGLAHENGDSKKWLAAIGSCTWALGLACGDAHEGGDGHAVIAEFAAAARTFRVIVGWCARRAKDAQESDGVAGDSVVITATDYKNLETIFRPFFNSLARDFYLTTYGKIKNSGQVVAKQLRAAPNRHAAGVAAAIPGSRPYFG